MRAPTWFEIPAMTRRSTCRGCGEDLDWHRGEWVCRNAECESNDTDTETTQ